MCYKCSICDTVRPAGTPRLTHVVYKDHKITDPQFDSETRQIAAELPVCWWCDQMLKVGTPISEVKAKRAKATVPEEVKNGYGQFKPQTSEEIAASLGIKVKELPSKPVTISATPEGVRETMFKVFAEPVSLKIGSQPVKGKTKKQRKQLAEAEKQTQEEPEEKCLLSLREVYGRAVDLIGGEKATN